MPYLPDNQMIADICSLGTAAIKLSIQPKARRPKEWLPAATDIDNRKPAVAEADLKSLIRGLVKPVARAVRPPMKHQVGKADKSLAILMPCGPKNPSKYPTHGQMPCLDDDQMIADSCPFWALCDQADMAEQPGREMIDRLVRRHQVQIKSGITFASLRT